MTQVIKIKRGLDIHLKGKASNVMLEGKQSETFAVTPSNYQGISPKVIVKPGDKVGAGSAVMIDKNRQQIKFAAPVSGEIIAVNRGEKRKLLNIVIKPDAANEYVNFGQKNVSTISSHEVRDAILEAGLWPVIRQRPYDVVAAPDTVPRDIFLSAFYSAPLAPDFLYILRGRETDFRTGLEALAKLTEGKVYAGIRKGFTFDAPENVELVEVEGPHPAANASVLINHIKPVNKGETVWTVNPEDVITIGALFNKGIVDFTRLIAITGSETTERGYIKTHAGCTIRSLVEGKVLDGREKIRIISGNVLTGTKVGKDDYLGAYDSQITIIPEGDNTHDFLGWAMPGLNKFSISRTFLAWILGKSKEYVIDARIRGGRRAMIMSNEYDKVFPFDIYPEFLLKAIIAFDIDKMENLGIYEVAPEDFALCEFVDTSKIELQRIVRDGLNLLYKEMN
ncbi:MAG: Na(+)-translocating NADH-quinone reductase subunit A [Tannerellaceae bacterium]|jgi:Na+-transporting NADH:ubiquinone oxidoreductase subunit A|nr:Na(+)-translocating NADH-quinone reductase subunit A [Tannerellaceae bacterium]